MSDCFTNGGWGFYCLWKSTSEMIFCQGNQGYNKLSFNMESALTTHAAG